MPLGSGVGSASCHGLGTHRACPRDTSSPHFLRRFFPFPVLVPFLILFLSHPFFFSSILQSISIFLSSPFPLFTFPSLHLCLSSPFPLFTFPSLHLSLS